MFTQAKPMVIVAFLFVVSFLNAFSSVHLNQAGGHLQNDVVHDVFLYDTSQDNIPNTWRTNTASSWYNEPHSPADDFTGANPSVKWSITGAPVVNDYIVLDATGIGLLQQLSSSNRWLLTGDFDIRIRYRDIVLAADTEIFLQALLSTGRSISIGRFFNGSTHYYIKRDSQIAPVYMQTTATDEWMRIVRSSGTISVWQGWWDSVPSPVGLCWRWTQIGSSVTNLNSHVTVNIGSYNYGAASATVQAEMDDFYCDCPGAAFVPIPTPTRSTVEAFPEKALIVATDLGLDILDAETNEMWMRFRAYDTTDEDHIKYQNMVADKITTVYALDGRIYCGADEGNMQALAVIDFTTDSSWAYDHHLGNGTGWRQLGNIACRNLHQGWSDQNQVFVQLTGVQIHDISVKMINGQTYVAVANGTDNSTNKGVVSVINISNNTQSWDLVNTARPVILVDLAPDNSLLYVDYNMLAKNSSTFLNPGLFAPTYTRTISTVDDIEPAALVSTDQFVYVAEKALINPYTNGATTKYSLSNLTYQNVVYKIGGTPTVPLWGSASCQALASNGHALWLGTNNSSHGRIYIVGIDGFQPNMLRGDFNYPSPLPNREISCMDFGLLTGEEENLFIGFNNAGVCRISGNPGELSVHNMENGTIQHNFNTRSSFPFSYNNKTITFTPNNSGTLGTLEFTLLAQDPPSFHPQHTLDFYFHIEMLDTFGALPARIQVSFTDPVPDGVLATHIWRLNEAETYWIIDTEDVFTQVNAINFAISPYTIDFHTTVLGKWAFNDGDGGMLSFPPQAAQNATIELQENILNLNWTTSTIDAGGYPISDPVYPKIIGSLDGAFWWDCSGHGTFMGNSWQSPVLADKLLYRVVLWRNQPLP